MNEATYEEILPENNPNLKREYWDVAFGLQEVDGLKPSKYLRELSEEHIRGEKTYEEIKEKLANYYETTENDDSKEADDVSAEIYKILENGAFRFDLLTFKDYHKRLFGDLNPEIYHPGEFRTVNLKKKEAVLGGETVEYQDFGLLEESLKYDFEEQSKINLSELEKSAFVENIANFTSRIWQVHPFFEGNTRTTAVFIQKYLRSLGFKIDNELFKNHSLYFRNALVRANYNNYEKSVFANLEFLEKFFENLLFNAENNLDNKNLYI
ncbi:MAG: Fic family protein [Candidatus Saccharibacteria bacterium]|nr:Fic family protein [Candidatus Saccharibacteria bacterium]